MDDLSLLIYVCVLYPLCLTFCLVRLFWFYTNDLIRQILRSKVHIVTLHYLQIKGIPNQYPDVSVNFNKGERLSKKVDKYI